MRDYEQTDAQPAEQQDQRYRQPQRSAADVEEEYRPDVQTAPRAEYEAAKR
jgi:hypothetical protein